MGHIQEIEMLYQSIKNIFWEEFNPRSHVWKCDLEIKIQTNAELSLITDNKHFWFKSGISLCLHMLWCCNGLANVIPINNWACHTVLWIFPVYFIFSFNLNVYCSFSKKHLYKPAVQSSRKQPECCGGGQTPTAAAFWPVGTHRRGAAGRCCAWV